MSVAIILQVNWQICSASLSIACSPGFINTWHIIIKFIIPSIPYCTDAVTSNSADIFSDVIDEFSKMFSVVMHFREWKYSFPTSYQQAYLSLCLPKLLKPYITLQLISWNPLISSSNNISLEHMQWVQDLLFFVKSFDVDPSDSDLLLIPRIVESIIIPKLTGKKLHVYVREYNNV